jgi:HEPN domain-containing protein
MPPDPQRLEDTKSWILKAANDLRYAGIDLAADPPAPEDAVFHGQQAVEKALKAFLVWHDVPFPKTHDLGKLGNQAVQLDPSLEQLVDRIVDLSKYAWIFRYPGDPVQPTNEEASEVLGRATSVVDEVRLRIFGADGPDSALRTLTNSAGLTPRAGR